MVRYRDMLDVRFTSRFSTIVIVKVSDMFMSSIGLCLFLGLLLLVFGLDETFAGC